LTTSEMGKPGASCVVSTPGAVVAVLTDGYSNRTGIRVPVSIPVGYPDFQIPYSKVRALQQGEILGAGVGTTDIRNHRLATAGHRARHVAAGAWTPSPL